ncbi:MAG: hypothetical protein ABFD66_01110 [Smithella sp.]
MLFPIGDPQYPDSALPTKEAVQDLTERTRETMQQMMDKPELEEKLGLSLHVRVVCFLFLAVQIFRLFGTP